MLFVPFRWLYRHLSTLLLAFLLAVVVWVSAVISADPNEVHTLSKPVSIEVVGLDSNLLLVNRSAAQAQLTLNAPQSIWVQLNNRPEVVRAWIDLTGLGAGRHSLEVHTQIGINPVQVLQVEPAVVSLNVEQVSSRTLPVRLIIEGEPSIGYTRGNASIIPAEVTVTGPVSLVDTLAEIQALIDISGASASLDRSIDLRPLDRSGNLLSGLTLSPKSVTVRLPVNLLGGYRNMVVKVVSVGQVANGYRLTSISVLPPTVTLFSGDPQQVNEMPGYVETKPLDLTDLRESKEMRAELDLPSGVSLVGEQSVLVEVGVSAIEGSLTISLPIEVRGLPPDLAAQVSPAKVDVLISGPLPVLMNLTSASVRLILDMTGMGPGIYQVTPQVDLLPAELIVESIVPATVEVNVAETIPGTQTPTPVPVPFGLTPTPTPTVTPRP